MRNWEQLFGLVPGEKSKINYMELIRVGRIYFDKMKNILADKTNEWCHHLMVGGRSSSTWKINKYIKHRIE